jgi:hypothetical protein
VNHDTRWRLQCLRPIPPQDKFQKFFRVLGSQMRGRAVLPARILELRIAVDPLKFAARPARRPARPGRRVGELAGGHCHGQEVWCFVPQDRDDSEWHRDRRPAVRQAEAGDPGGRARGRGQPRGRVAQSVAAASRTGALAVLSPRWEWPRNRDTWSARLPVQFKYRRRRCCCLDSRRSIL